MSIATLLKKFQSILRTYKREYFDFIYYRYRNFDIKGLSIQGSYNLEQQEVYIDAKLSPIDLDQLALSMLLEKTTQSKDKGKKIWEFIDRTSMHGNKIVIIGDPGSGKTTLLKQIALAFCKFRNQYNLPNKVPILLFLRNHVEEIIRHPDISVLQLNKNSLENSGFKVNSNWFEKRVIKGECVVLLDGVDEIGNAAHREEVIHWIEKQVHNYPKNHFIITTRPHGILNNPINGTNLFRINLLDLEQIENFIYRWYLANETRRSQKFDQGVEMLAKDGAQDLLSRIQNTDPLQPLAQNPLLLTMIALVHRFNAQLPGRRVELYDEIFRVFFRRREVVGIDYSLTPEQSRGVLIPLANFMMQNNIRDIELAKATDIIKKDLAEISKSTLQPEEFLKSVEQQSGLIRDIGGGMYAFASLTFQEYLASIYYVETKKVDQLVREISNTWWWETIRLYSAQADATRIIEACLDKDPLDLPHLQLAIYCLEEALRVDLEVSSKLNEIISSGVEHEDPEWRNAIASALLLKRLRWMQRIDAHRLIDRSTITNVEYQIFIDEEAQKGSYYYPDHWTGNRFPKGLALKSIVGIRADDARKFCDWLIPRDVWRFRYRLPTTGEDFLQRCDNRDDIEYWVLDGEFTKTTRAKRNVTPQNRELIIEQMVDDTELFNSVRAALEREKNTKTTTDLLATGTETVGRSSGARQDYQSLGELQSLKLRDDEWRRFREHKLLERFTEHAPICAIELEPFLEISKVVFASKEHSKSYEWVPSFPMLSEYGFDLSETQLAFDEKYPIPKLMHLAGKKVESIAQSLRKAEKIIFTRDWKALNQTGDWNEIYYFIRAIVRMGLLTIAYSVQNNKKDIEQENLQRDIANLYLAFCILEKRINGTGLATEGIRLVKYS